MTEELLEKDSQGNEFLNCTGGYRCAKATMKCDRIHCEGSEACQYATMDFTARVECTGLHACHYANITLGETKGDNARDEGPPTVYCAGNGGCDVARISGLEQVHVTCFGMKACRKAYIEANTIHCTMGSRSQQACNSFASLLVKECLVCGHNGCPSHINQCRYQFVPDGSGKFLPCEPETLKGTCSEPLQQAFELEINGEEEGSNGESGGRK